MTRYNLKSTLGNNVSDVRCVQALMKDQDIYYGPCDGVMTPYMGNSLARFNKTGFANEKVGDLHILKPNGSTLTNLGKRASGYYADMKSLINLGEVISCKDDDWKLDIGDLTSVGMDTKETDWIRKGLKKIWNDYKLPFRLHAKDFKIDNEAKWQFTLRFPPLKWLQSDCNFNDVRPDFIVNDLNERLRLLQYSVTAQTKDTLTLTGPLRELVALKYETGKCAAIKQEIIGAWTSQIRLLKSIYKLQLQAARVLRTFNFYSDFLYAAQKKNKKKLADITMGLMEFSADELVEKKFGKPSSAAKLKKIKFDIIKGPSFIIVDIVDGAKNIIDLAVGSVFWQVEYNNIKPELEAIQDDIDSNWLKFDEKQNNLIKLHENLNKQKCVSFSYFVYNEYAKKIDKAISGE